MARFRKKPVVVEAFRITDETRRDNRDWPNWLNMAWNMRAGSVGAVSPAEPGQGKGPLRVVTLEGSVACNIGDWIIKGVKDELYPCRDDIFRATYDEVPMCDRCLKYGDDCRCPVPKGGCD